MAMRVESRAAPNTGHAQVVKPTSSYQDFNGSKPQRKSLETNEHCRTEHIDYALRR